MNMKNGGTLNMYILMMYVYIIYVYINDDCEMTKNRVGKNTKYSIMSDSEYNRV